MQNLNIKIIEAILKTADGNNADSQNEVITTISIRITYR